MIETQKKSKIMLNDSVKCHPKLTNDHINENPTNFHIPGGYM